MKQCEGRPGSAGCDVRQSAAATDSFPSQLRLSACHLNTDIGTSRSGTVAPAAATLTDWSPAMADLGVK